MLQHEITPFADAHIAELEKIKTEMVLLTAAIPNIIEDDINDIIEMIKEWEGKLTTTQRGFTRFKVCAEDEWKQKERYRKYAKENGYPYS